MCFSLESIFLVSQFAVCAKWQFQVERCRIGQRRDAKRLMAIFMFIAIESKVGIASSVLVYTQLQNYAVIVFAFTICLL